ncbi:MULTISPECIES: hypothetical protein [unclassified Mesorhizobium]|uniref:hypothetical protein n=1 Tax=unclassified Mesorhizobium TaxID=325217 RepID=UPI0033384696
MRVRILQVIAAVITIVILVFVHDVLAVLVRMLELHLMAGLVVGGIGTIGAVMAVHMQNPAATAGVSKAGRYQISFVIAACLAGTYAFWFAAADTIASGRLFVVGVGVGIVAMLALFGSLALWDRRTLARRQQ